MSEKIYTRYSATINLPNSGYFPLTGDITTANMLMLANSGTTPHFPSLEVQLEAERIERDLRAGKTVLTRTATITPSAE